MISLWLKGGTEGAVLIWNAVHEPKTEIIMTENRTLKKDPFRAEAVVLIRTGFSTGFNLIIRVPILHEGSRAGLPQLQGVIAGASYMKPVIRFY